MNAGRNTIAPTNYTYCALAQRVLNGMHNPNRAAQKRISCSHRLRHESSIYLQGSVISASAMSAMEPTSDSSTRRLLVQVNCRAGQLIGVMAVFLVVGSKDVLANAPKLIVDWPRR